MFSNFCYFCFANYRDFYIFEFIFLSICTTKVSSNLVNFNFHFFNDINNYKFLLSTRVRSKISRLSCPNATQLVILRFCNLGNYTFGFSTLVFCLEKTKEIILQFSQFDTYFYFWKHTVFRYFCFKKFSISKILLKNKKILHILFYNFWLTFCVI